MIKTIKTFALAGALAAGLAACQTTEEALQEEGAIMLSAAETQALFANTTRAWASGNGVSFHDPDGAYLWKMNSGDTGEGSWYVTDTGDYCIAVEEWYGDNDECFTLYRTADGSYVTVDGDGVRRDLADGEDGNTM